MVLAVVGWATGRLVAFLWPAVAASAALAANEPDGVRIDPWGSYYLYVLPNGDFLTETRSRESVTMVSPGPNRVYDGGEGDDLMLPPYNTLPLLALGHAGSLGIMGALCLVWWCLHPSSPSGGGAALREIPRALSLSLVPSALVGAATYRVLGLPWFEGAQALAALAGNSEPLPGSVRVGFSFWLGLSLAVLGFRFFRSQGQQESTDPEPRIVSPDLDAPEGGSVGP